MDSPFTIHVRTRLIACLFCSLAFLLVWTTGCGPSETTTVDETATSETTSSGTAGDGTATAEEEVEVLLEPFDPPSLEDLVANSEWEDMPVRSSLELLAEQKQSEPALVTAAEAVAMRNDSPEANKQILSVMGHLPKDGEADDNATVIRHSSMALKSTNPLMVSSVAEGDVAELVFPLLTFYDRSFTAYGDAEYMKSWKSSKDRKYDIIELRDDWTWSDGKPVTAHDFVFSFQTIMNPKVPIPALRSSTEKLRWVHAYDDYTLVFFHKESLASWRENLQYFIVPKHLYENSVAEDPTLQTSEIHQQYENSPVTCGPYEYASRKRSQEIVLKRRESFYMHDGQQVRDKPFFKEVRIKIIEDPNTSLLALKKGDIEEAMITAEQWSTNATNGDDFYEKNTKATGLEWVEFHFVWNCESPYFSDKRVRQAMSFTFDHDEMIDKIFYGLYEKCNGPFHHTANFYPKNPPPFFSQDLDKAEELLDEAGWDDSDGDGTRDKEINGRLVPFEFNLHCSQTPNSLKVSELFKDNLDQIGIICNVKPTEFTVLMQTARDHKFHGMMGGWGTGTDPSTLENIFGSGQGRNYGLYSNPKVDELFAQGGSEFDIEKRYGIYAQLHEQLAEDQPYTWLFYRNSFWGFNKKLRGYNFSPRGVFGVSPGFRSLWVPAQATP